MLCQNCKKREANTHIVRTVGNNTVEMYLCSECASENGYTTDFSISNFLFSDFLSSPFMKSAEPICPICKTRFSEISKSGTVGCGECYKAFSKDLTPTISRLHSLPFHKGKRPGIKKQSVNEPEKDEKHTKEQEIEKLKSEQSKAIESEDFEKAAVLRDRIKELEGGKADE